MFFQACLHQGSVLKIQVDNDISDVYNITKGEFLMQYFGLNRKLLFDF
jgi:hypothetical protein